MVWMALALNGNINIQVLAVVPDDTCPNKWHSKFISWAMMHTTESYALKLVCACSGCFRVTSHFQAAVHPKDCLESALRVTVVWAWYNCFKHCEAAMCWLWVHAPMKYKWVSVSLDFCLLTLQNINRRDTNPEKIMQFLTTCNGLLMRQNTY